MDNNTNSNPAAVEQPIDTHADTGGNGGQGKTFTQEDVNRIVSERLAREREKAIQQPTEKGISEREAALIEREKAIQAKENREQCRAYLKEKNISYKRFDLFLDNLNTDDIESFKKTVDVFGTPYVVTVTTHGAEVAHPPKNMYRSAGADDLSSIFKPKI